LTATYIDDVIYSSFHTSQLLCIGQKLRMRL
jgi:hypothetical protein